MANRVFSFRLGIMLRFRVLSASFSSWDSASFSSCECFVFDLGSCFVFEF